MAGRRNNGDAQDMQPSPAKKSTVKRKKVRPIGAGKAFALGLLASFIISALFGAGLVVFSALRDKKTSDDNEKMIVDQREYVNQAIAEFSLSPSESVRNAVNEVVANITVTYAPDSPKAAQTTHGAGILFQMSPDGEKTAYIMTTYHVIEDAANISVLLQDTTYSAKTVGAGDKTSDIAVLRIDDFNKKSNVADQSRREDTDPLSPGEWCMSVGNPHGFNNTMTVGTVSAVHRNIPRGAANDPDVLYANMIQTDAALNPGNSGGGIWDSHGRLLGMVSLIWSSNGGNEGIGFAIPKDYALRIAETLVQGQTPAHANIGAALGPVPEDVVASYGLQSDSGAYIMSVEPAGAAERATLIAGDIIKNFDNQPIQTVDDVILIARGHAVGDQVPVTVSRQGKEMQFTMTLGSDAAS